MSERQHTTSQEESPDSPDLVLAALHSSHQVATQVEIDKLRLAIQWAIIHPVESIDHGAATVDGTEGELAIAGAGAPLIAEFCVADLALALGMSTDAGRTYLGDAIELRYRLPKLWSVTVSGRVPVWKARKIAQTTKPLCPDAASHVDRHLAHQAHRCSYAQIDRAVDDALRRYAPPKPRSAADKRPMRGTSTSTSPTPSTSTTPSPTAPPTSPPWAVRSRWTGADRWPPEPSPATSSPWTSNRTRTQTGRHLPLGGGS